MVATACLESVYLRQFGAETLAALPAGQAPTDLLGPFRFSTTPSSFCQISQALLTPHGVQGRPVLGTWTVTFDVADALSVAREGVSVPTSFGPDPAWLLANSDVTRVTVYMVMGLEGLASGELLRYGLQPAP